MASLKTLQKRYELETSFYEYCLDSFTNGNFQQTYKLFMEMSRNDRKGLIKYILEVIPAGAKSREFEHFFNML